jgi:uncharacterized protein involved in exopolysaccharide biosynthesis
LNTPYNAQSQLVVATDTYSDVSMMPQQAQPGMSPTQLATILGAYWKLSVLIAMGVVLLTALVVKYMPKTYTATAQLSVNYDASDPLAGKEFPEYMIGGYMATQIELMQSSEVLDPVIAKLNLEADPDYAAGNKGGEAGLRDWVESKLRKNLEIAQGPGGSLLIDVTASAHTAAQAADIANAVADVYVDEQYKRLSGPLSDRAKRYTEELADLKGKVALAQEALAKFRARSGDLDQDGKSDVDVDVLNDLEHKRTEAMYRLRAAQARAGGRPDASSKFVESETVRGLRADEERLRQKMAQLSTLYGPNHPQVVELQNQINANHAALEKEQVTYTRGESSEVSVAEREVADLGREVEKQQLKVQQSHRIRDEGAQYRLAVESAENVYKRALDGYDQIIFRTNDHSSNVTLASRARQPVKADKPNPIKYMALGVVLGVLLGLVVPFVIELLNRRVRCSDDVERDFGIPVLVEFPAIDRAHLAAA